MYKYLFPIYYSIRMLGCSSYMLIYLFFLIIGDILETIKRSRNFYLNSDYIYQIWL